MLNKPVCIIGAARSGTTLLSRLLAEHPDTTLLNEPKYLWRYGKPEAPHDRRTAKEATPRVREYIRSRLNRHVREEEGTRLVEKTPSNCFRVPFVHAILPEARFVHLIRDGRDVAFSAREQWRLINGARDEDSTGESGRRVVQNAWDRVRSGDVPLADLPYYAAKFAKTMFTTVGMGPGDAGVKVWGPKFPGIREIAQTHDLLETCAIQWRESVRSAREGFQSVPDEQCLRIRFEGLVRSPVDTMQRIIEFAELSRYETILEHTQRKVNPSAAYRWQDRDSGEVDRVMEEVGDFVHEMKNVA